MLRFLTLSTAVQDSATRPGGRANRLESRRYPGGTSGCPSEAKKMLDIHSFIGYTACPLVAQRFGVGRLRRESANLVLDKAARFWYTLAPLLTGSLAVNALPTNLRVPLRNVVGHS